VEHLGYHMLKARFLIGLTAFSLSACTMAEPSAPPGPASGQKTVASATEDCKKKGGDLLAVGMMGREHCVIPFKDAGKACNDGSQCEGDCWAKSPRETAKDGKAAGTCQPTNMPFGCNSRLDNGVASPVLCVD
jgi:putative hemolysin